MYDESMQHKSKGDNMTDMWWLCYHHTNYQKLLKVSVLRDSTAFIGFF